MPVEEKIAGLRQEPIPEVEEEAGPRVFPPPEGAVRPRRDQRARLGFKNRRDLGDGCLVSRKAAPAGSGEDRFVEIMKIGVLEVAAGLPRPWNRIGVLQADVQPCFQ
jgi:hypothetical protein